MAKPDQSDARPASLAPSEKANKASGTSLSREDILSRDFPDAFPEEELREDARLDKEELPYVNEVDAALARMPDRSARLLSLAVGLFFLCFLVWAAMTDIDEVTHAQGQIVSAQRTQTIQNLEGGILQEVLVYEGQVVEKGTLLARLSNEMAASTYRDAVNKALEAAASIIRLDAELTDKAPVYPPDFGEDILKSLGDAVSELGETDAQAIRRQIITNQMALYNSRRQQQKSELALLEAQVQQRQAEVKELEARKTQTDKSLALAIEQRNIAQPLVQKRAYSRVSFLELEQKVNNLQGEVAQLAASIPRAQSAALEAEQRIASRQAEINAAVVDELNKRHVELTSLRETLNAGGDRVTRTELRSPVQGTIQRIYISTVGGVVKPGEPIMEIVPLNDTLLVEARIRPADVAFLHPGQKAMIKISAYDFSIYGGLEATLEQISADTIKETRGAQEDFYYRATLHTKTTELVYHMEKLPIIPGMMAQVDILTGKKSVLDYLLKPILKARQNALRER